jgi:hypothetical protein
VNQFLAKKYPVESNPVSIKTSCASARWIPALATVLVLLLLGRGFGDKWTDPLPQGQPAQIKSQVNYNPKLSDPFFEAGESYTAQVFTSFQYDRFIKFCDAKLLDGNTVELFIHEHNPSNDDNLRIVVENGVFWSQYWYYYKDFFGNYEGLKWTTTKQELTLDKQVYRRGDVIKGKIDFECIQENKHPRLIEKYGRNPRTITLKGVFKTILK